MFDLNSLCEFSRNNCIAICTFLVPANLIVTLQTLIFTGLKWRQDKINWLIGAAIAYASVMILHVITWFMAGVVMAPTFILTALGVVCLTLNLWALGHPSSMSNLLRKLWVVVSKYFTPKFWRLPSAKVQSAETA